MSRDERRYGMQDDNRVALAEAYRCGYEAGAKDVKTLEKIRGGNRETAAIVMVAELADRIQQVPFKPVYTYGLRVALEVRDYAREMEDV